MKKKEVTDFGFITFDSEQVDEIVQEVGLKFNSKNYLKEGDKSVRCSCCGHVIRRNNIGNVLPGSNIIYCDNPTCFADYMNKYLNL